MELVHLSKPRKQLVTDTSAAINLMATGFASEIIAALSHEFLIVDVVERELANGHKKGRAEASLVLKLIEAGLFTPVTLEVMGQSRFEELVSGSTEQTLDDGEAATIAFALQEKATALIDERKATKICVSRFSHLEIASTIDLLRDNNVQRILGPEAIANALFNALTRARMGMLPIHHEWVAETLGAERIAACNSLPYSLRARFKAPS